MGQNHQGVARLIGSGLGPAGPPIKFEKHPDGFDWGAMEVRRSYCDRRTGRVSLIIETDKECIMIDVNETGRVDISGRLGDWNRPKALKIFKKSREEQLANLKAKISASLGVGDRGRPVSVSEKDTEPEEGVEDWGTAEGDPPIDVEAMFGDEGAYAEEGESVGAVG